MRELIERMAPGSRVVRCEVLKGGVSAAVEAVTVVRAYGSEERVVVRRHREIEGKVAAAARAEREFGLLEVLWERGVKVPRPRVFGAPETLVVDFVEGSTVLPAEPAGKMAEALAAIHAIDVGVLPALPELREAEIDGLVVPRFDGEATLLHGDFWPGNVMWRDGEIVAVLDWEDAAIGDPLSDLACARVELVCAAGEDVAARFTEAYRAIRPIDEARLALWDLYVSTAALTYMEHWGLEPDVLARRREATRACQARARAKLAR